MAHSHGAVLGVAGERTTHQRRAQAEDGPGRQRVDRSLLRDSATDDVSSETSRGIGRVWRRRRTAIANRIPEVLSGANTNLASVGNRCSACFGRTILEAVLAEEQHTARLARDVQRTAARHDREAAIGGRRSYAQAPPILAPTAARSSVLRGIGTERDWARDRPTYAAFSGWGDSGSAPFLESTK